MLKESARVTLKEKPFSRKGADGREFTLCKYWVVIEGAMFNLWGDPNLAKEGDLVPLMLKASDKGTPIVVFAKPL